MKNAVSVMLMVLLCLACDETKRHTVTDSDVPDHDAPPTDTDELLPDLSLPDISEAGDSEEPDDALVSSDEDTLLPDEDLIIKTPCLETGEGCGETEICLFDWALNGYYCEEACDPLVSDSCPDGMVCEAVTGDTKHGCFLPVFIAGRVFDLSEQGFPPIEGARVSATNVKTGEGTDVVLTGADGAYAIALSLPRERTGMPTPGEVYTMRAVAKDYEPYPSVIRASLPILMDTFTKTASGYFVASGFLDIGLLPLPEEKQGGFTVSGNLSEHLSGVLVIARCATAPCPYTYTDNEGFFALYNVQPSDYEVAALKSGMDFTPVPITVTDSDITDLLIERITEPTLGSIAGQVNIVNAPGGLKTSVVLMAEETFIPGFDKGEMIPGLRAPAPPEPPSITGAYTITGIPAGNYVVLAAFENDYLVRDPDPGIAGTQILHLSIPDGGGNWNLSLANFKVTEALAIIYPGAEGPELVDGENLVFRWEDDSSETHYNIKVFDAYGTVVWEKTIPGATGTAEVSLAYDGPKLSGYYQWRVTSIKSGKPISMSEDLRGIFYIGLPW